MVVVRLPRLQIGLTMFLQFGAMQVFGNRLMRSWLAGEDEVAAGILDGGDDRLAGKQIVAEIDRPEVSDRRRRAGPASVSRRCARNPASPPRLAAR